MKRLVAVLLMTAWASGGLAQDAQVKPVLPHIPADLESRLIKNDFAFAAKNRDKILAEWNKRYNAKSEPK